MVFHLIVPIPSSFQTSKDKTTASVMRRLKFLLKKKNYNATISACTEEVAQELVQPYMYMYIVITCTVRYVHVCIVEPLNNCYGKGNCELEFKCIIIVRK